MSLSIDIDMLYVHYILVDFLQGVFFFFSRCTSRGDLIQEFKGGEVIKIIPTDEYDPEGRDRQTWK